MHASFVFNQFRDVLMCVHVCAPIAFVYVFSPCSGGRAERQQRRDCGGFVGQYGGIWPCGDSVANTHNSRPWFVAASSALLLPPFSRSLSLFLSLGLPACLLACRLYPLAIPLFRSLSTILHHPPPSLRPTAVCACFQRLFMKCCYSARLGSEWLGVCAAISVQHFVSVFISCLPACLPAGCLEGNYLFSSSSSSSFNLRRINNPLATGCLLKLDPPLGPVFIQFFFHPVPST